MYYYISDLIQVYYVPFILEIVFVIIVSRDSLLPRNEKKYFLIGILLIFFVSVSALIDNTIRAFVADGHFVRVRRITSAIQYGVSPYIVVCALRSFMESIKRKVHFAFYIPAYINLVISFISIYTEWVFSITDANRYTRGAVHWLPAVTSLFYYFLCLLVSVKFKTSGRKEERYALFGIIFFLMGAYLLELIMSLSRVIWPACVVSFVIYYMVRQIGVYKYDTLTGAKSRRLYEDFIDGIKNHSDATLAMIDMNNLKTINDEQGHSAGDKALTELSRALIATRNSHSSVYRYGGDEFVVAGEGLFGDDMKRRLEKSQRNIQSVDGIEIKFAFSVSEYHKEMDMAQFLNELDGKMYENKKISKDQR